MSNINKILLSLALVLIFVFLGLFYFFRFGLEQPYYAVYLETGDLYFGKLSVFPRISLSDAWYLQKSGENNQGLSLARFGTAVWGPENKIYLNNGKIIWKAELRNDSPVLKYIKGMESGRAAEQIPAGIGTENDSTSTRN